MKTLLLSVPLGMSVRNVLRSDIYTLLRERCRLIIMSPHATDAGFREEFAHHNVEFVLLPHLRAFKGHGRLLSLFIRANYWGFWLEKHPETADKYAQRLSQESGPGAYFRWMTVARLWNTLRQWTLLRGGVESALLRAPDFGNLRRRFGADAVLTVTHDVVHDIVLMVEAKRQGLPVAVMIHSWDGLPSRGRMFICPGRLLVWNEIMAEQARRLHSIPSDRIHVTGIPQYDDYLALPRMSRLDYLKQWGIEDPQTRLITYTCSAERVFPDEPEFIDQLLEIMESGVWGPAVLIIRLHPTERQEQYRERFEARPSVRISEPDPSFAATWVRGPIPDGRPEFVNLMTHSDVVINLASTTTIDAVLFDTPVVNVAYNPLLPPGRWNRAKGWYRSSHFKHIMATGGTRLARSREELIRHVADYLDSPKLDAEGRERIRCEQCYRLDGQSSWRVAACVLNMMGAPNDLFDAIGHHPATATVQS